MTVSALIVLTLRIILPLTILKNRITGAILSMALGMLDVVVVDALQAGFGETAVGFGENYQMFDKWLDMYYLSIEAVVCLGWPNRLAKVAGISLFLLRLAGISALEIRGEEFRKLIGFFPNLFENFFLYYIICERFAPRLIPKKIKSLLIVLLILYLPKFPQEYFLHFSEVKPWQWFRANIL
jgi:hypothetical protein